jgi:hypothetical protein
MQGDLHAWAVARGITPYHPAEWSDDDRRAYEAAFGWAAPWSDTYRECPCHPHGFARGTDDDVSDAELAAYVADDPARRAAYSRTTARALAYLHRFAYAYEGSRQQAARRRVRAAMGKR